MQQTDPIVISDQKSLIEQLTQQPDHQTVTNTFWVEWKVLPPIGPDWIGGGRAICFYLNQRPLIDNSFHQQLKTALIQQLNIPATSHDDIINGEGDITFTASHLKLTFEWQKTRPYQYAHDTGYGEISLIALADLPTRQQQGH